MAAERWYICKRVRRWFQPINRAEAFAAAGDAEAALFERCQDHDRALEAAGADTSKHPPLITDYRVMSASDLKKAET